MATKSEIEWLIKRYHEEAGKVSATRSGVRARWWWAVDHITGLPRITGGNQITPLIDGQEYMKEVSHAILNAKKYILLTAWLIDHKIQLVRWGEANNPNLDEAMALDNTLRHATLAGVEVRIVLWKRILAGGPSGKEGMLEQKSFLEAAARGKGHIKVVLYDQTRLISSIHQKTVVVDGKVAFCGGIDLTKEGGDHWDTPDHWWTDGRRAKESEFRRNWHDVAAKIEGPAVKAVQENFKRRWQLGSGQNLDVDLVWDANPTGSLQTQILRTIPEQGWMKYPQPSDTAEYSVVECYAKAIVNAQQYIYIENQYFSCSLLLDLLLARLKANAGLRLMVLLPKKIESPMSGDTSAIMDGTPPEYAVTRLRRRLGKQVSVMYRQNVAGQPVYVHAKVMIVDDIFATVGSANFTERSMFNRDEELNVAWMDKPGGSVTALRKRLWAEHLQMTPANPSLVRPTGKELFQVWTSSPNSLLREWPCPDYDPWG